MASQEDCYFFFNSTCSKGDDCAFRHESGALGNPVVCEQWKNGTCERNQCHLRHGNLEVQTSRSSVPCYYESLQSGCLNFNCNFLHQKPRPFRADYQFNNTAQLRNPRPPMAHPRLNTPFPQRFSHPHMQQFRGPHHPMEFSPRKMQSLPHEQRFTSMGLRPAIFPNPPREPIPGRNLAVPPMFHDGKMGLVNHTVAGEKPFEPRIPGVMTMAVSRAAMNSGLAQGMATDVRMMANPNHNAIRNDGPGLLGEPPIIPFPFGGLFPFNIPQAIVQNTKHENTKPDRSEVKRSSKRTVKKFDKRYGKSDKNLEHRGERRTSQEVNSDDMKRKRKEKKSNNKDVKGTTKKHRKVKKDSALLTKSKSEERNREEMEEWKDFKEIDEEANLAFKVKTLEEILRDKALKKLRQRQQMMETPGVGGETNAGTGNTPVEPVSLTNNNSISDNTNDIFSQLKPGTIPPLRTKEKSKPVENDKNSEVENHEKELSSGGNTVAVGKSNESSPKVIACNLSTVKVKTLDEIRQAKLKKLAQTKSPSAPELKTMHESETKKPRHQKLKPLKPLKNPSRGRKPGTNAGDERCISGSSGTSSNVTSEEDQKKPLPAITRITNVLKSRSHAKTLSERLLKRKLDPQIGREQTVTPSKIKRLTSGLKSGFAGSVVEKALRKVECGDVTGSVKEIEVSPYLESKEENVESTITLSDQEAPKTNDVAQSAVSKSSLEKKTNSLYEASKTMKTDDGPKQKLAKVTGKPVKMIRLKRLGLMKSETGNDVQGKTRILQNALGRRIKLNQMKPATVNNDVLPSPTSEGTKQGGPQLNTTDDTSHENSVKAVQRVAMDEGKISSNTIDIRSTTYVPSTMDVPSTTYVPSTTDVPSTTVVSSTTDAPSTAVNDEGEPCDSAASKYVKSHVLGNTPSNSSHLEKRSDEVPKRSDIPAISTKKDEGVSSLVMVSDIPYAVMKKMCRLLNIKSAVGNDFRALAGELGMKTSDVRLLSLKDDPADEVLKWWEPQKSATVKGFREILIRIKRADVLAILDEGKQEDASKMIKERLISEKTSRKSTLDQLVKEVSDDMKDEEEDLLDEALEKAIAELSPAPSDDEEEISNADDLLLEIEEMINS